MPTPKTECTELSVGFGLLGLDPLRVSASQIGSYWVDTLSARKFSEFTRKFSAEESYYRRFFAIGVNLCHSHKLFKNTNITTVRWEGPQQQASSVTIPIDLIAANTPVSVKADSNIVCNRSPHILFVSDPGGTLSPARSENWYTVVALNMYQSLYDLVHGMVGLNLPVSVVEYHQTVRGVGRKRLGKAIQALSDADIDQFNQLYTSFCHEVAHQSAELFNRTLNQSLAGPIKNSITENIIRRFFRLGDSEYVLCGLDGNDDFGVTVPALTAWKRGGWSFKRLIARPDLLRGQSVVNFELVIEERDKRKEHCFPFHAEVRWSHGKFAGNPEAKLYKEFAWTDVPFFQQIYAQETINRLQLIGSGGFGTVYKAILRKTGQVVAIKELDVSTLGFSGTNSHEERKRFEREVKIQSSLDHPNVLPVIECDLNAAIPWFAMPLASCCMGEIISDLRGNLERINKLFQQVLTGIAYAHYNNVIHRDLKPENILLFENDLIKISDFGLGKQLDVDAIGSILTHSSNNALGSLPYAAPEQLESFRDADYRADIYALGKTLLHMLSGKVPVSTSSLNQVDERYRDFINCCIQEDPNRRFQSVTEAVAVFDAIINS
jgi:tRNA A-37 threonylcarbamoyl transferase component Bud32